MSTMKVAKRSSCSCLANEQVSECPLSRSLTEGRLLCILIISRHHVTFLWKSFQYYNILLRLPLRSAGLIVFYPQVWRTCWIDISFALAAHIFLNRAAQHTSNLSSSQKNENTLCAKTHLSNQMEHYRTGRPPPVEKASGWSNSLVTL